MTIYNKGGNKGVVPKDDYSKQKMGDTGHVQDPNYNQGEGDPMFPAEKNQQTTPDPQPPVDAGGQFQENWGVDTPPSVMEGDPNIDLYTGEEITSDLGGVDPEEEAYQREVQENETVQGQMSQLLSSDSKYMQDARRQGLEQANAMGGLGGTVGVGAAQTSALRAALPIAQQDAATYYKTASENMQALNDLVSLNHQRATQLELGEMDSNTRVMTSNIGASAQMGAQRLQNAASRDIARLDAATKERVTQMQGAIQARLAQNQFKYDQILQDAKVAGDLANTQMRGEYGLAGQHVQGEYQQKIQTEINRINREANYTSAATGIYEGYMNRLADLNGMEMDDAARERSISSIAKGAQASFDLLAALYPDIPPIEFNFG
jgi:hypothetical protein